MVVPEIFFCADQTVYDSIIPSQLAVDKFTPKNDASNIPSPLPCDRHIVVALHYIMERDIAVLPLISVVSTCCLAL